MIDDQLARIQAAEEVLRLENRRRNFLFRLRNLHLLQADLASRPEGWEDCRECDDGEVWIISEEATEGGFYQDCPYCGGKEWFPPHPPKT